MRELIVDNFAKPPQGVTMKPGTIVRLPDGREGTVVYHGPDGYGIKWGRINVDVNVILSLSPITDSVPEDYQYKPDAMLREPYTTEIECVGEEYEVVP